MANRLLCARYWSNYACHENCVSICISKFFKRDIGMHIDPKPNYKITTTSTEEKITPPSRFTQRRILQYAKFLQRFEKFLEKYPEAKGKYLQMKDGFFALKKDFFTYNSVSYKIWRGEPLKNFTREQLTVYRQMPSQMWRTVPLLVLSVLPGGALVIALAFTFPKIFLTTHFMTTEQRIEYEASRLRKRLQHMPVTLDHFAIQSKATTHLDVYPVVRIVVDKLDNGFIPEVEELTVIVKTFASFPYQTEKLHKYYARKVGLMNGLKQNARKLSEDGLILLYTDLAMLEEGIGTMTDEEIMNACFMRGLNADGLSKEEMVQYLTDWTTVAKCVNKNSASLLLHMSMLMAYNHPNNIRIMPKHWKKYMRLSRS